MTCPTVIITVVIIIIIIITVIISSVVEIRLHKQLDYFQEPFR